MSKPPSGLFSDANGDKEEIKQVEINLADISDNITELEKAYPKTSSRYFGERGTSSKVRIIKSKDQYKTAQEFWDVLSRGGGISILSNKHGIRVDFSDESYATYRVVTKTKGSPAIEINIKKSSNTKSQKIHFMLVEGKK